MEAGWDRSEPSAEALNRLRARRPPLDGPAADRAAAMVRALRISVADAHIADVLASPDGPDVVLTSDTDDLGRILAYTGARVRIVRLSTAPQLHERADGPELVGSGPSITAILTSLVGCVSPNYSALR